MICTSEINTITIIFVLGIIMYLVLSDKNNTKSEYEKKIHLLGQMISESKKNITNKIEVQQQKLKNSNENIPSHIQHTQHIQHIQHIPQIIPMRDHVIDRDRSVVDDQLYPPLGRVERPIFDQLVNRVASGFTAYPTRGSPDTFRMVGYMVNSENKNDSWKLFGRQKYPGSSIGEYYAIPFDDKKADMKITIKDDMMPKDKIRDIYALPNEVTIKSPLFSDKPYTLVELDKADLTSPYL